MPFSTHFIVHMPIFTGTGTVTCVACGRGIVHVCILVAVQSLSPSHASSCLSDPPQEAQRRIERLPVILQQITQSAEEDEEDPFSSTFEALRVMQSTISTFNSKPPTPAQDKAGSDTSSEYTTPAQSQSSSPIREQSPPPSFQPPSLLALNVHPSPHPEQLPLFGSPSTSPTHTGSLVSRLATHGASASRTTSQEDRGRTSPPGGARHGGRAEAAGGSPRRCSDPGSRHFSTKMQTCETEYSSGW